MVLDLHQTNIAKSIFINLLKKFYHLILVSITINNEDYNFVKIIY